jgi:hypothetical protein
MKESQIIQFQGERGYSEDVAAAFYVTIIDGPLNLFILRFYNEYHYLVPSASADASWRTLRKLGQASCFLFAQQFKSSSFANCTKSFKTTDT